MVSTSPAKHLRRMSWTSTRPNSPLALTPPELPPSVGSKSENVHASPERICRLGHYTVQPRSRSSKNLPKECGNKGITGGKTEEAVLKAIKGALNSVCLH